MLKTTSYLVPLTAIACLLAGNAHAHAMAGARVFPATLAVEDPGISDELTLPQVNVTRDAGGQWSSETSAEFSKRLTGTWAVSVGDGYSSSRNAKGFDNVELGVKNVFYTNAAHEFMLSASVEEEFGHSGARSVADGFNTTTPALYFGKGLGDLPDSAAWLKPFAFTGTAGWALPSQRRTSDITGATSTNPQTLQWGGSVQYSLPYLQQHVKDLGLPKALGTAVPVVEFAFETPTSGSDKQTTGTINPGVLFVGQTTQFGLEATVPMNHASGNSVGFIAQLHFYLDELFPQTVGKPIW